VCVRQEKNMNVNQKQDTNANATIVASQQMRIVALNAGQK
jgi:hypothetical protein